MGAWLAYAREHGKKLSFGEWGLIQGSRNGGGDNPVFIEKMLRFFARNAGSIGYETYFNRDTSSFRHRLRSNPRAAARYRDVIRD